MKQVITLLFGALFGFFLSRSRATDYEAILGMFRLKDFHIAGVMAVGIATAALGLWIVRGTGRSTSLSGDPMSLAKKPSHAWLLPAGILFGVGWALTGACPGTALGQLGEGKLYGGFTVLGMLVGTLAFGLTRPRS